jgi:hypothetical protein
MMKSKWISFLSAFGIPVLGICGLFFSLWQTGSTATPPAAANQELTFLQDPSPLMDRSMTVCLNQQAIQVARSRAKKRPAGIAQAVADYNLVARECTPAVFAATHLPESIAE